ncbi:uncharacterized protein LOC108653510 isoform X1 [Drosophila navojoa]|uniref:uncharacterized protein LOC108653510 isoform X1 n=1 Tax=Drosophila navojoa TaxID=7232 RepID=UPI0011BDA3F9|nr:uncharacterized protein LOC108653510 isoform X1 [Drosophila navojoa]
MYNYNDATAAVAATTTSQKNKELQCINNQLVQTQQQQQQQQPQYHHHMIPTSVTNSPPAAGLAQNGAGGTATAAVGGAAAAAAATAAVAAAAASSAAAQQSNYNSIVLGLASLILEGRPISDDEYQQQYQPQPQPQPASSSGRHSPRPSTSRAAINITTNPYAMASGTPRSAYGQAQGYGYGYNCDYGQTSSSSGSGSNGSSASSATHQRWTQKLCQLRQVSPAAQSMSAEPELVALSINDLNADRGDFEIVRRVMLNRAGATAGGGGLGAGAGEHLTNNSSSAGSSPGSDNILHSLQSLATTCLRGGPAVTTEARPLSLGVGLSFGSPTQTATVSAASLLDYNCSRTPLGGATAGGGGGGGGVGGGVIGGAAATSTATASNSATGNGASSGSSSSCTTRPKHGPHCDQFLRKMGLAKGDSTDTEEHFCDMSYVNITCSRWRAHCMKMEAILARREPVCIEVYLGPAGHKILLEQWIISGKEKVPPPTMTLPSLCSAIRSQLYFSQIVAWCDLLRKCDPSVYDSGRVIFASGNSNNAGDLAGQSGAAAAAAAARTRRPRLNIFYRIRPHDLSCSNANGNDGGFSAKANVHNFPHVNIAENFSVAVCVKSLPRFNGGLPHVSPSVAKQRVVRAVPAASTPTGGGGMCAATPTGLGARIVIGTTPPASSCDKYGGNRQQEAAVEADDLDGHREKQLQKYRKRMQRRDKKRERKPSEQLESMEPMDEGNEETQTQAMALTVLAPPRRIAMISTGTQTSLSSCQQCGSEKTLLCLSCEHGNGNAADDAGDTSASEMEDTSSCSLSSSDLIVGTPRSKAELLLQAIQRTPKNRKPMPKAAAEGGGGGGGGATAGATCNDLNVGLVQGQSRSNQNNNQVKPAPSSGCQVCKRQKTQHNFANGKAGGDQQQQQKQQQQAELHSNGTNGHSKDGGSVEQDEDNSMEQELALSGSTKLTPNIDRCSLNAGQERCQTPTDVAAGCVLDERIVVQFKTPISHVPLKLQEFQPQQQQQQQQQQLANLPAKAANQLRLNCNGSMLDRETPPPLLSPLLRKALPKVNLTTIFCSSSSSGSGSGSGSSSSAPITIDSSLAFCFETPAITYAQSQSQSQSASLLTPPELVAGNLPVQKSYSAPTLPNALSVSPRFAKQAAFYKRRSRHLSDRSDRSSLGSDEQLSDEDLESGMCSPAGSPLKSRARLATQFGGRPLLGNLEESLLQKRLLPKIEVAGFRLQLGASGGFCPTQLTIPASSYFYELHGETLSTPYLCEIRLPRKGYFVPRSGTVQATLLNPMGTVVRMFVIPYDMRDMPPLHRTFIRQRILAEELPGASACVNGIALQNQQPKPCAREPSSPTAATSTTSKLGHFITAEQMKRLRYSIHLRFQTSRSGRLSLHTDIRLLISRRTDCDTAAAHAKGLVEAANELVTDTLMPQEPRYSARQESPGKI